jgi:type IV secretory pathway VirB4 component
MKRTKYIIETRNKLANIADWFNSMAAINGAELSQEDRNALKEMINNAVSYIDKRLK